MQILSRRFTMSNYDPRYSSTHLVLALAGRVQFCVSSSRVRTISQSQTFPDLRASSMSSWTARTVLYRVYLPRKTNHVLWPSHPHKCKDPNMKSTAQIWAQTAGANRSWLCAVCGPVPGDTTSYYSRSTSTA